MLEQGVRLQLFLGRPDNPMPAPFAVVDALTNVTVINKDNERDGFQMTFTLGRDSTTDSSLLTNRRLEPRTRVIISVILGVLPQILIDGLITQHQMTPSNRAGDSTLVVTGEDLSRKLDLQDRNATYRNQSDSAIVETILRNYGSDGITAEVTNTSDQPQENQRITTQHATDCAFIQELASRNHFVFYIEPTAARGRVKAYWGPERRSGSPQPDLRMNMGAATNLESLSFTFDALGPTTPGGVTLDSSSRQQNPVSLQPGTQLPLAREPAAALRTTLPRNIAHLERAQAERIARALAGDLADAVTGSGEVDIVRYGQVLKARRLVRLVGAGGTFDGQYYVKEVTHNIRRGEYRQSFLIKREGRGRLA